MEIPEILIISGQQLFDALREQQKINKHLRKRLERERELLEQERAMQRQVDCAWRDEFQTLQQNLARRENAALENRNQAPASVEAEYHPRQEERVNETQGEDVEEQKSNERKRKRKEEELADPVPQQFAVPNTAHEDDLIDYYSSAPQNNMTGNGTTRGSRDQKKKPTALFIRRDDENNRPALSTSVTVLPSTSPAPVGSSRHTNDFANFSDWPEVHPLQTTVSRSGNDLSLPEMVEISPQTEVDSMLSIAPTAPIHVKLPPSPPILSTATASKTSTQLKRPALPIPRPATAKITPIRSEALPPRPRTSIHFPSLPHAEVPDDAFIFNPTLPDAAPTLAERAANEKSSRCKSLGDLDGLGSNENIQTKPTAPKNHPARKTLAGWQREYMKTLGRDIPAHLQ
ncbi:MAG: hypothetical protein Q9164_004135 [Protoblastenia rupestris]